MKGQERATVNQTNIGNVSKTTLRSPQKRGEHIWAFSIQFSSVPLAIGLSGERERRFSRDPLLVFSAGGHCEQRWPGQGCPLFDVVYPAFPLPTTMSPTLQVTLKDGFGEAVLACDMPELCKFLSLDSCQKRLLVLLTQRNFLYLWHLFN